MQVYRSGFRIVRVRWRVVGLAIIATALGALVLLTPARSQSYGNCGFRPLKPLLPLGCTDLVPVCECDARGNHCGWRWICVQ